MAYVEVTKELADMIKSLRVENKISAKELAQHIERSPAYVTKLEKAEIRRTDEDTFKEIIKFILKDNFDADVVSEKILKSLSYNYTKKEIEQQIWFVNYDTILRLIPVPKQLAEYMKEKLMELNIDSSYLTRRINANESLPEKERNDNKIKPNRWYASKDGLAQSIKMMLEIKDVEMILNQEITTAPYTVVFSILFYILKIESFKDNWLISDEENATLMKKTTKILNEYKFYSLLDKQSMEESAETDEQLALLLSSFDNENRKIISEILERLNWISELNVKVTNERLQKFKDNMDWDLGFVLKLISLNFHTLEDLNVSKRKEMINEIECIIEKYSKISDEKEVELY